ncbi:hypothetical protein MASR1M101_22330 [Gemmatimonas sp.]
MTTVTEPDSLSTEIFALVAIFDPAANVKQQCSTRRPVEAAGDVFYIPDAPLLLQCIYAQSKHSHTAGLVASDDPTFGFNSECSVSAALFGRSARIVYSASFD